MGQSGEFSHREGGIMSDLDRAAQIEYLLDHYQNPRNYGEMADADVHLRAGHEGCGDIVTMYLKMDDDRIAAISYTGEGCTISQAAASIITELVKDKTMREVEEMDYRLLEDELGTEPVQTRPRCATLGLDTVKQALQDWRRLRQENELKSG